MFRRKFENEDEDDDYINNRNNNNDNNRLRGLMIPTDTYVCVLWGKKFSVFRKIWRALFSGKTRFEIRPFAILPMFFDIIFMLFMRPTVLLWASAQEDNKRCKAAWIHELKYLPARGFALTGRPLGLSTSLFRQL